MKYSNDLPKKYSKDEELISPKDVNSRVVPVKMNGSQRIAE